MEFLGRRVRILPTADSDLGQLHAGEYGEIRRQVGTLQETHGEALRGVSCCYKLRLVDTQVDTKKEGRNVNSG
jgi:hypothetical protein